MAGRGEGVDGGGAAKAAPHADSPTADRVSLEIKGAQLNVGASSWDGDDGEMPRDFRR